jgi:poly(A) polymerase
MELDLKIIAGRNDVRLIAGLAAELGVDAFLVGGALRDSLLERETNDLDFALSGACEDIPRAFAERISGSFFWLDKKRLQGRVVEKRGDRMSVYDFAPLCGASIEDDLRCRDFTINALALPLFGDRVGLIDPLHGRDDLLLETIRSCSAASFDDDPLRLLRAIRFSAELGFEIEISTWNALCAKTALLKEVAAERIRDELFRTLAAPGCGVSFRKLIGSGLWETIHPLQGPALLGDGIARAEEAERTCTRLGEFFPEDWERLEESLSRRVEGGVTLFSLVKLAAFLGRGETRSGATLAVRLRLGRDAGKVLEQFTRDERELYIFLEEISNGRPIHRFFRDREPAGQGMLIVARAFGDISETTFCNLMGFFLRDYDAGEGDLFLSGGEIMDILGIPPGRTVGRAMARLREAEGKGQVNNREEARQFIKNLLTKEETIG